MKLDDIERMLFLTSKLKAEQGLLSVQVALAPENYFDLTLQERAHFLQAPSTFSLCKTIIMQNSKYAQGIEAFPDAASDPFYPQHIAVVTQFEGKLNAQKLVTFMKHYQNTNTQFVPMSSKCFHFRLAGVEEAL